MNNIELISSVADKYELSPEQAREILLRALDQEITSGTPPITTPTQPAQHSECSEVVTRYGIEYCLDPSTITEEQEVFLEGLTLATGEKGEDTLSTMLEEYGVQSVSELSEAQALDVATTLQKTSPKPQDKDFWYKIMAIAIASNMVLDPIWMTIIARGQAQSAAGAAGRVAGTVAQGRIKTWLANRTVQKAAEIWGRELAARQGTIGTQVARTAQQRLASQLTTAAQERAAQMAAEQLAARGGQVASTTTHIGMSAAQRATIAAAKKAGSEAATAAANAGASIAQQAAARTAAEQAALQGSTLATNISGTQSGSALVGGLYKAAPYLSRAARAVGPLTIAALPFEVAYSLMRAGQSQVARPNWEQVTQGGNAPYYELNPLAYAFQEAGRRALEHDPNKSMLTQSLGVIPRAATGLLSGLVNYPFQRVNQYVPPTWGQSPRAGLISPWGGYQQSGGGAFFGGEGRQLYIPGITEPWREV